LADAFSDLVAQVAESILELGIHEEGRGVELARAIANNSRGSEKLLGKREEGGKESTRDEGA